MKNLIKILILLVIIGITTIVYIITKLNIKLDDKDSIGYSERAMEITVSSIGVSLEENGEIVSYRNYIDSDWSDYGEGILFSKDIERFIPGKIYPENITVRNTGGIDIYARIIVTRSFVDEDGSNSEIISPELISLGELGSDWVIDERASTETRTVYYYTLPIEVGEGTSPVIDYIQISPEVSNMYTISQNDDGKGNSMIATTVKFDKYGVILKIEADAVQARNAADAILSAWGVNVDVSSDGHISLK